MPIYEYQCQVCEQQFEEMVRHAESEEVHCPRCGTDEVSRLFSLFGVGPATGATVDSAAVGDSHSCGCGGCTCGRA